MILIKQLTNGQHEIYYQKKELMPECLHIVWSEIVIASRVPADYFFVFMKGVTVTRRELKKKSIKTPQPTKMARMSEKVQYSSNGIS